MWLGVSKDQPFRLPYCYTLRKGHGKFNSKGDYGDEYDKVNLICKQIQTDTENPTTSTAKPEGMRLFYHYIVIRLKGIRDI